MSLLGIYPKNVAGQEWNDLDENIEFLRNKEQGRKNVLWPTWQLKGNVYLKFSHGDILQINGEIARKQ